MIRLTVALDRSSDPIRRPDQDYLEPAAASLPKQLVETRPLRLRARDPVGVLGHDFEAALLSHRAEVTGLSLGMLVKGRYSQL